jgi:UDP-3-O-[3-hydroxymyristoyl] glucosamine N-acyltransferase
MIVLNEILGAVNYLEVKGNSNRLVEYPVQADPSQVSPNTITWVSDKNIHLLQKLLKGVIICSPVAQFFHEDCTYIVVENPRLVFRDIIEKFFDRKKAAFISPLASIAQTALIGHSVTIEPYVVVEENCIIGDNSIIGSCTVIKEDTIIGNNVKIGSNNTIGGVGFGYEKDLDGHYTLMPHLGNVIIKDFVEIGNNTCIDRAVMGSTILHENVKVDNLVHIAHGVQVGANSLIIANAMIGGSTEIGKNVWFAPSASVLNKKKIGDNAVIGMAAVVVKNVQDNEVIVGNPGKPLVK